MSGVTDTTARPYPLIPQMDWMRDLPDWIEKQLQHSDDCALGIGGACDCPCAGYEETLDKLTWAYKYILWSRRCFLIPHTENKEVNDICFWMMIKYHRLLFDIPLTPAEEAKVDEAYSNHKKRLAAFKAKRK